MALCDKEINRCGGRGSGIGTTRAPPLFWATSGGLRRGWFERTRNAVDPRVGGRGRRGRGRAGDGHLLPARRPIGGVAAARVTQPFELFVVAHAWRGRAIDRALDASLPSCTTTARPRALPPTSATTAGSIYATRCKFPPHASTHRKGFVAIACLSPSRDYLERALSSPARVPLLLTREPPSSPARMRSTVPSRRSPPAPPVADIRHARRAAYAAGEGKPLARVERLLNDSRGAVDAGSSHARNPRPIASCLMARGASAAADRTSSTMPDAASRSRFPTATPIIPKVAPGASFTPSPRGQAGRRRLRASSASRRWAAPSAASPRFAPPSSAPPATRCAAAASS